MEEHHPRCRRVPKLNNTHYTDPFVGFMDVLQSGLLELIIIGLLVAIGVCCIEEQLPSSGPLAILKYHFWLYSIQPIVTIIFVYFIYEDIVYFGQWSSFPTDNFVLLYQLIWKPVANLHGPAVLIRIPVAIWRTIKFQYICFHIRLDRARADPHMLNWRSQFMPTAEDVAAALNIKGFNNFNFTLPKEGSRKDRRARALLWKKPYVVTKIILFNHVRNRLGSLEINPVGFAMPLRSDTTITELYEEIGIVIGHPSSNFQLRGQGCHVILPSTKETIASSNLCNMAVFVEYTKPRNLLFHLRERLLPRIYDWWGYDPRFEHRRQFAIALDTFRLERVNEYGYHVCREGESKLEHEYYTNAFFKLPRYLPEPPGMSAAQKAEQAPEHWLGFLLLRHTNFYKWTYKCELQPGDHDYIMIYMLEHGYYDGDKHVAMRDFIIKHKLEDRFPNKTASYSDGGQIRPELTAVEDEHSPTPLELVELNESLQRENHRLREKIREDKQMYKKKIKSLKSAYPYKFYILVALFFMVYTWWIHVEILKTPVSATQAILPRLESLGLIPQFVEEKLHMLCSIQIRTFANQFGY